MQVVLKAEHRCLVAVRRLVLTAILCLVPTSRAAAQDLQKILGLEDSQVHTVWSWETVDLEQHDIWNVMGHVQALPPAEYGSVAKSAKPWTTVSHAEITPDNCWALLNGRLSSIRKPRLNHFAEASNVQSEAEALELATRWVDQDTEIYWCELDVDASEEVAGDVASPSVGVLVTELPKWIADHPGLADGEALQFKVPVHVTIAGVKLPATAISNSNQPIHYQAVMVGKNLEWYPQSKLEIETVAGAAIKDAAADWLGLAERGFDLGLLPRLYQSQRAGLVASDSEPFYQLLATARIPKGSETTIGQGFPITKAIVSPRALVGRRFQQALVVKQITQVPLGDEERGRQLGLDRYYLLHALMPLEKDIRLQRRQGKEQIFQQQFPVLVACRTLPDGWELGDQMRQWCQVDGTFVKLWSYESAKSRTQQIDQWAPLLVAHSVLPTSPPNSTTTNWPIGWLLMIPVGVASLGLLWGGFSGWKSVRRQ